MRLTIGALLLVVTLSASAGAQGNQQTRQGFWISSGFGFGSTGCVDCDERESGGHGYLRMGGTLSQRILIGAEVNGWSKSDGDARISVGNFGPMLYFYPNADGGFFLKGGLGLAKAPVEVRGVTFEDPGVGLTLGLGFDARVGRNFTLAPYFDILTSNFDRGSFNTIAFGLGFTWP